jgi:hypothetical protein
MVEREIENAILAAQRSEITEHMELLSDHEAGKKDP